MLIFHYLIVRDTLLTAYCINYTTANQITGDMSRIDRNNEKHNLSVVFILLVSGAQNFCVLFFVQKINQYD